MSAPDATPEEMAVIIRKITKDQIRQLHMMMWAQIAKETFDGNYGKYENRPRDNTSFKDSTLDPNYRSL